MGILLIQEIKNCQKINSSMPDSEYDQKDVHTQDQIRTSEAIDLQNQAFRKTEEMDNDYTDYKIMKPLNFWNNPIKSDADFSLWNC